MGCISCCAGDFFFSATNLADTWESQQNNNKGFSEAFMVFCVASQKVIFMEMSGNASISVQFLQTDLFFVLSFSF